MLGPSVLSSVLSLTVLAAWSSIALWALATAYAPASSPGPREGAFRMLGVSVAASAIAFLALAPISGPASPVHMVIATLAAGFSVGAAVYLWREIVSRSALSETAAETKWKDDKIALVRAVDDSRRRLRDIAEISGDWIWQTDERGDYTYVSDGIRALQGLAAERYLGRPLFDIAEPDPGDTSAAMRSQILARREPFRNILIHCLDGKKDVRIVRISGSPLTGDGGGFIGFHGLASDITAEYRLQEERATAGAKDMFLASMSHEIRTPLNGVLGILEILGETQLSPDQRQLVGTAMQSGESLLHLINDVLDFSKIQAGRFELSPAPDDLSAVLDVTVSSLRPLAKKRGNALTLSIQGGLPRAVVVDAPRYRQILVNLIGNAIKFTESGTIAVQVACSRGSAAKVRIRTSVRDTGPGIPASKQSLLFKEFSMLDDPSRVNTSGTGLGLALCKKLTEAMGGEIGVESREGAGSTFWFEAEFDIANALRELPSKPGERSPGTQTSQPARPMRILMAEDNPTNALVVQRMLDPDQFTITHVTDGQQAVDASADASFDIILMDVSMPVMDGLTATARIRERERRQRKAPLPIIALTAHAIASEQERIMKAGITAIVSKPFRKQALLAELARCEKSLAGDRADVVLTALPPASNSALDARAASAVRTAGPMPAEPPAGAAKAQQGSLQTAAAKRSADPLAKYGPVLDRTVLAQLAEETGTAEIPTLLAILRTEMQSRASQLRKASATSDVGLLMTTCHALAGSAGTVGATRLYKLCKQTETACLKQKDPRYLSMVAHILREIDFLLAALSADVDVSTGPGAARNGREHSSLPIGSQVVVHATSAA